MTPVKRGREKVKSLNKIADQAPAEKRASWTWAQRLNLQDTLTGVEYGVFSHFTLCLIKLNTARANNILRILLDTRSIKADTSYNKVDNTMSLNFDEMISAPCRLSILATLVPGAPVSFTAMKAATSLSDGNLHVQTRKLADVGYIEISKIKRGRRTVTEFRITKLGRDRLQHHVMKLQKILDSETDNSGHVRHTNRPDDSMVWA